MCGRRLVFRSLRWVLYPCPRRVKSHHYGNSRCRLPNRLCEGDSVTKIMAGVLFVALGLATFAAPVAVAKTSSAQDVDHASQAKARKDYLKQQKKQRKNAKKSIKKEQKQFKKQHPKSS